jgi:hypothetical protein
VESAFMFWRFMQPRLFAPALASARACFGKAWERVEADIG